MKKFLVSLCVWSIPTIAIAATTLYWTQPSTNTDGTPLVDLKGNKIYCGNISGQHTTVKDVGLPSLAGKDARYPITSVVTKDGVYFCAVTAYDTHNNESGKSNEVTFPLDNTPPGVVTGVGVD